MPNDLKINIIGDATSGYEALQKVNKVIGESKEKADVFTKALENAQAAGQDFNESVKTAAGSLEGFLAAENAATQSAERFTKSTSEAAGALEDVLAAENAATQSAERFTKSTSEAAGAGRNVASGAQAATTELRVLQGSMMGVDRAAGNFLANTLGLGPALAALGPAFGVLAAGTLVFDLAEGMAKLSKEAQNLADITGTNWLSGAIYQLTGFGEQLKEDQKAIEASENAIDRIVAKEKQDALADVEAQSGKAARYNAEAAALLNKANADKAYADGLSQRLALERQMETYGKLGSTSGGFDADMALLKKARASGVPDDPGLAHAAAERDAKAIEELDRKIEDERLDAHRRTLQAMEEADKEYQSTQKKESRTGPAARQPNYQDILAEQELEQGKSLGATVLYWERVVATTGKYHEQLLRAEEAYQKQASGEGKIKPMLAKMQVGPPPPAMPPGFLEHKETEAEANERINRALEAQEKSAAAVYEETARTLDYKTKMGEITERQAAAEKLVALNASTNKQVSAIGAEQKQIAPLGPINLDEKQMQEWQSLEDRKTQITQSAALKREQIAQQEAEKQKQQYDQMFSAITGPLNQFTEHWLTSNRNMAAAAMKMVDQVALNFIMAEVKMLEKHLAAAAEKQAIDKSTAVSSISAKAADAAAGSWSALSNIPIIGPLLGAAAAAATYAGVMALAAFETGTDYVPKTGMAILHEGEAVLDRDQNRQITRALASGPNPNGGQGSGAPHFHFSPTYNAIDGASVQSMAMQHGRTFVRETQRQLRLANRI